MASSAAQERLYRALLEKHGQAIADAFMAAIADIRTVAQFQRLQVAIERGNLVEAIDALHLDPAAYSRVLDAITAAYQDGGAGIVDTLPKRSPAGEALIIRFDVRAYRAEDYLKRSGAELVTRIIEDQRQAVRQQLVFGMERGDNSRITALNIVGRTNKAGVREGGIIGLTAQQQVFAQTARQELESGDPEALRNYLTRTRRDRRFDRTINAAIAAERPLQAETVRKASQAYERRLLQLRGETVGRTEALTALNAGQDEGLRQAVDTGQLTDTQVKRRWDSAGDRRVRHTHAILDGKLAGLNEPFVSASGARIMFPGDPAAPAAERIGCRCWLQPKVDWFAGVT